MRVPGLIVLGTLSAVVAMPPAAKAQFSPQGIIGAATAPLRDMLGQLRHFPHPPRHRARSGARSAAPAAPAAQSRLALIGPPVWPGVYEDLVGYVFWPAEYEPVRDRGFDVIADTITGTFPNAAPLRVAATTGAAPQDDAGVCGNVDAKSDWPQARLEEAFKLSDDQRAALEKLQAAVVQSTKAVAVDCRGPVAASPPDRLAALVQALWTARDTGLSLRAPIRDFVDTLSAAQQAQLAPPANNGGKSAAAKVPESDMQGCAAQNIGDAERMVKMIEQRTRPTKEQAGSLEQLHKTSTDMAKLLVRGCAQPIPATPQARLDAAADQLTTLNYAATAVQIAFNDFYRRLDDRQKARLNSGR
jgi:hypothetical protein